MKTLESIHTNFSGEDVLPNGGDIRLISELAKNTTISLNEPVASVEYAKNNVTINTEKGAYNAKYAIVTLPLGVLQADTVKFSPELPHEKLVAIKNLRMGIFNKVYLLFDKVFWNPDIEWLAAMPDPENPQENYEALNLYKYYQQPILLFFTAGSFSAKTEEWGDQEIVADIMRILKLIYGNNIPTPSSYLLTRWSKDPFARGSYSYPRLHLLCKTTKY